MMCLFDESMYVVTVKLGEQKDKKDEKGNNEEKRERRKRRKLK